MVERILEETTSEDTDLIAPSNGKRIDSCTNGRTLRSYASVVNSNRNDSEEAAATMVMKMNNNNNNNINTDSNNSCTELKNSGMFFELYTRFYFFFILVIFCSIFTYFSVFFLL